MFSGRRYCRLIWYWYVVGMFPVGSAMATLGRSEQNVLGIDGGDQVLVEGRADGFRRIGDGVENAVALDAVIVDAAAGAQHDVLFAGDVPGDAETRTPLQAAVLEEVLAHGRLPAWQMPWNGDPVLGTSRPTSNDGR